MAKVINVDFKVSWMVPVHVRIGDGFREKICGPDDALECLNHRWPSTEDDLYETAKRRCVAALCQNASAEEARTAFVNAASKAKMLA